MLQKSAKPDYRYRAPYFIVDRLFGAAELRLGGGSRGGKDSMGEVVRIERTDGIAATRGK